MQTQFKAVRAPLDLKRTISTWLGVGRYKWYQSQSRPRCEGLFGPMIGVYQFGLVIPWDSTKRLCLHGRGFFVMSHVGQGIKFLALYKYELFLILQTCFKTMKAPLDPKQTISTRLGRSHYKWYQSRSSTLVWRFVWPCKECLFFWPHNPMGYNEDVVFAWGCL